MVATVALCGNEPFVKLTQKEPGLIANNSKYNHIQFFKNYLNHTNDNFNLFYSTISTMTILKVCLFAPGGRWFMRWGNCKIGPLSGISLQHFSKPLEHSRRCTRESERERDPQGTRRIRGCCTSTWVGGCPEGKPQPKATVQLNFLSWPHCILPWWDEQWWLWLFKCVGMTVFFPNIIFHHLPIGLLWDTCRTSVSVHTPATHTISLYSVTRQKVLEILEIHYTKGIKNYLYYLKFNWAKHTFNIHFTFHMLKISTVGIAQVDRGNKI